MSFTEEEKAHLRSVKDTAVWPEGYLTKPEILNALRGKLGKPVNVMLGCDAEKHGTISDLEDGSLGIMVNVELSPAAFYSGQTDIDAWLAAYKAVMGCEARSVH